MNKVVDLEECGEDEDEGPAQGSRDLTGLALGQPVAVAAVAVAQHRTVQRPQPRHLDDTQWEADTKGGQTSRGEGRGWRGGRPWKDDPQAARCPQVLVDYVYLTTFVHPLYLVEEVCLGAWLGALVAPHAAAVFAVLTQLVQEPQPEHTNRDDKPQSAKALSIVGAAAVVKSRDKCCVSNQYYPVKNRHDFC